MLLREHPSSTNRPLPPIYSPPRAAPVLFWFLNNSLIYSTGSADVWLARFFGATAGVAATFLMLPLTPLVVETARRCVPLTRLFDFDANISSELSAWRCVSTAKQACSKNGPLACLVGYPVALTTTCQPHPPAVHRTLGYLVLLGGVVHSISWWTAFGRTVRALWRAAAAQSVWGASSATGGIVTCPRCRALCASHFRTASSEIAARPLFLLFCEARWAPRTGPWSSWWPRA